MAGAGRWRRSCAFATVDGDRSDRLAASLCGSLLVPSHRIRIVGIGTRSDLERFPWLRKIIKRSAGFASRSIKPSVDVIVPRHRFLTGRLDLRSQIAPQVARSIVDFPVRDPGLIEWMWDQIGPRIGWIVGAMHLRLAMTCQEENQGPCNCKHSFNRHGSDPCEASRSIQSRRFIGRAIGCLPMKMINFL